MKSSVSILGVVPAGGGAWRRLTDPRLWADKARWAPDGKAIYFISNRERAGRIVVPILERAGSVWVLDHIDR
jgi:Tol biopolymer transport system component